MITIVSTISTLNLDKNTIAYDGAFAIGDMLKENTKLITLTLKENQIENNGAVAIAEGLKVNAYLRYDCSTDHCALLRYLEH
jgi:hypothetical protein